MNTAQKLNSITLNKAENMKNSETQESIILLVVQRTLAFPFFFGIAFVGLQ